MNRARQHRLALILATAGSVLAPAIVAGNGSATLPIGVSASRWRGR